MFSTSDREAELVLHVAELGEGALEGGRDLRVAEAAAGVQVGVHDVEGGAELGGHRHMPAVHVQGGAPPLGRPVPEAVAGERPVHGDGKPSFPYGTGRLLWSSECRPQEQTSAAGAISAMRASAASRGSS